MAKRKSLPTKRKASYASFRKGLNLVGLGLESVTTELARASYMDLVRENRRFSKAEAKYFLNEVEPDFFNASAEFSVSIGDAKTKERSALKLKCAYAMHFHTDSPFDREHAERFVQSELRIIAWPYFRQLVQDITSRMAVPPIVVPLGSLD